MRRSSLHLLDVTSYRSPVSCSEVPTVFPRTKAPAAVVLACDGAAAAGAGRVGDRAVVRVGLGVVSILLLHFHTQGLLPSSPSSLTLAAELKRKARGGAARRNYLQFPSPASRLGLRYCPPPLPSKLTAPAHTREHLPHRESPGATRQRRLFFPLFPHPDAPSPPLPLSSFATMSSRAEKDKKRATLEELKAARAGGKRDYKVSVDARSFFSASLISRLLLHSLWRTRPSTTRSTNQTTRSLSRDGWQRTTSLRRTTA